MIGTDVSTWFGRGRLDPDPDLAPFRPTKKFREARRYYQALQRESAQYSVTLDPPWFDLWHAHPDWEGHGNRSWEDRRRHLEAGFLMFRRVLAQLRDWPVPHQVWLVIDAIDSAQDAVYVHTPNPNADNFPYSFDHVSWEVPVPERLRAFISEPEWQLGRSDDRWTHLWIRARPAP
jgi:hypothetical protein